jgi:hypothetical protein
LHFDELKYVVKEVKKKRRIGKEWAIKKKLCVRKKAKSSSLEEKKQKETVL